MKNKKKRIKNKKESKKREPQLNVEVDSKGTLKVESVNVTALSVKYYIINAELLFAHQHLLLLNELFLLECDVERGFLRMVVKIRLI